MRIRAVSLSLLLEYGCNSLVRKVVVVDLYNSSQDLVLRLRFADTGYIGRRTCLRTAGNLGEGLRLETTLERSLPI